MSFLSDDYKEPKSNRYMKPGKGETRFRILGSFEEGTAIMGNEIWVTVTENGNSTRKPVRTPNGVPVEVDRLEYNEKTGQPDTVKFFWILPVWNYDENRIEIMEITQKSIRDGIKLLAQNKKWGDPIGYDILVTQVDEKGKISYVVSPEPKEPLTEAMHNALKSEKINLKAMYASSEHPYGGDPFEVKKESAAPEAATDEINIDDIPFD